MIPRRYLPLPLWRRICAVFSIWFRRVILRQGYWYLDLRPGGKLLCTAQMWQVFDDAPQVRPWRIVNADHFHDHLATPEDLAHIRHAETIAKVFETVATVQFNVRSITTGSLMPVQAVLQFDYDERGKPFAMWGFAKLLRQKSFGLRIANIQAAQSTQLFTEDLNRREQERLLEQHGN